jgi:SAM-dependent methyltransferase
MSAIRRIGQPLVPARLRPTLGAAIRPLRYRGDGVECPCCESTFRHFAPHRSRPRAKCPRCGSLERHRLLWLYLAEETDFMSAGYSMLHFAPEYFIQRRFKQLPNLRYVSADLDSALAMDRVDIMDMPYEAESFDIVICSHVLEHVGDDLRALREVQRVMTPGGKAIVMSPIDWTRDLTLEDPSVTAPEDRHRVFGQSDHVRLYGRDFHERLEAAGFDVSVERYLERVDESLIRRYGLRREDALFGHEPIFVCAPSGSDAGRTPAVSGSLSSP